MRMQHYCSGSSNLTETLVIKPESAKSLFNMIQRHFHPHNQLPLRYVTWHYGESKVMGYGLETEDRFRTASVFFCMAIKPVIPVGSPVW
jgi:hypoxanthine-guanine phosphoribosyltransferase